MARKSRPFNPKALQRYALSAIRPQLGPETLLRRYTLLVPLEEIRTGETPRKIASAADLEQIQRMLVKHFGGVTVSTVMPSLIGWGARDRRRPKQTLELNKHAYFMVYAAALRAADEYFIALQKELAAALVEGVILVERQEVTIL